VDFSIIVTPGKPFALLRWMFSVGRGEIIGISNYFTGLSTAAAQGYGVFSGFVSRSRHGFFWQYATWNTVGYSPLAVPADAPVEPCLDLVSSGVTLEIRRDLGSNFPSSHAATNGTLCSLQLSQPANVSVTANAIRSGIILSPSDAAVTLAFAGAMVGPAINRISCTNGMVTLLFQDGELETATS